MSSQPDSEPIGDDELLYRRIPVSTGWYSPADGSVSSEAFDPRPDEDTGISIYRAKYKSLEEAGKGKGKKGYYVAEFLVADLLKQGIRVEPRPLPDDPGHSELPDLNCKNRTTDEVINLKLLLARLPIRIHGPFVPPS